MRQGAALSSGRRAKPEPGGTDCSVCIHPNLCTLSAYGSLRVVVFWLPHPFSGHSSLPPCLWYSGADQTLGEGLHLCCWALPAGGGGRHHGKPFSLGFVSGCIPPRDSRCLLTVGLTQAPGAPGHAPGPSSPFSWRGQRRQPGPAGYWARGASVGVNPVSSPVGSLGTACTRCTPGTRG